MHHFEQPARRRVVRKSVECCDFCWISGPQVQLAFQRNLNNCFQLFPVALSKKIGIARKVFFLQKKMRIDNFGMITPGRSRLFPTVSDCFSFSGTPVGPVDHWFNKNHNIQHFSSRPFCAQVARNDAFWLWNPIYPKNPKTPRPREIQYTYIYIYIKQKMYFCCVLVCWHCIPQKKIQCPERSSASPVREAEFWSWPTLCLGALDFLECPQPWLNQVQRGARNCTFVHVFVVNSK